MNGSDRNTRNVSANCHVLGKYSNATFNRVRGVATDDDENTPPDTESDGTDSGRYSTM